MALHDQSPAATSFDVIIVGAGISGINAAYRVQTQLPDYSYTIIEARDSMGGTWDLFKYPGIRSDSDLYTFGFPWRPWTEPIAIADGESIVNYIKDTAAIHGIDRKIQYHTSLISADFSTEQQLWRLSVKQDGQEKHFHAKFVFMATGYYDYHQPLQTEIPGLQNFKGLTVHPQFWPKDLDYNGKKMVIIGSGATAITLLPNLTDKAEKVTMLQRSPSYVLSLPQSSRAGTWLSKILPVWAFYKYTRIKFLILPWLFFIFCRRFPNAARRVMKSNTTKQLPANVPHDPHFNPRYNPWEQRMCVSPDGDFFQCLREGKADIATGCIKTVTEDGILLESGQKIDADIIITATGLKIQIAGGAQLSVDGHVIKPGDKYLWRGVMLQDLPNLAVVIGYTNASWTLGADATAQHVCRILKHMRANNQAVAVPRIEDVSKMASAPSLNLSSTYIQKAAGTLPKTSDVSPWQARASYFTDLFAARFASITDGLEFYRPIAN